MSRDSRSLYTSAGLEKLAQIIRQARGDLSFRQFQEVTGVAHGVIRRIENLDAKMPDPTTLKLLAPHTPYTYRQLQAIAMQEDDLAFEIERQYWSAEDVMPIVRELPETEAARLAQLIIDYIMEKHRSHPNDIDKAVT